MARMIAWINDRWMREADAPSAERRG
jgi:hypothetical protein